MSLYQEVAFLVLSATLIGMNRATPLTLYPVFFLQIHGAWGLVCVFTCMFISLCVSHVVTMPTCNLARDLDKEASHNTIIPLLYTNTLHNHALNS